MAYRRKCAWHAEYKHQCTCVMHEATPCQHVSRIVTYCNLHCGLYIGARKCAMGTVLRVGKRALKSLIYICDVRRHRFDCGALRRQQLAQNQKKTRKLFHCEIRMYTALNTKESLQDRSTR
jgi:hypothetical protein